MNLSTVAITICCCNPIALAHDLQMEIGTRLSAQDLELDLVVDDDSDIQATEGIKLSKTELYIQEIEVRHVDQDKIEQVEQIAIQAVEEAAASLGMELMEQ